MKLIASLSYNSFANVNDCTDLFTSIYAAQEKLGSNARFLECDVRGDYKYPNDIYVADRYVAGADLWDFVGLFADYNSAAQAAGEPHHIRCVKAPQN